MEWLDHIVKLRQTLHACPELSGAEVRTKAILQSFLRAHTSLELVDCGDGFYAAHREGSGRGIAFRADYDALPLADGGASHLCGHDGHAAALCGLALQLEGKTVGRDVFLLFQPAEETGMGALPCCDLFRQEQIAEIYGLHNLPGFPLGQVVTKAGTFACASVGMTISLQGKPTHAAYPEYGISPAPALGALLCALPSLADPSQYEGMTLCTVIGTRMGEKAFGTAAEKAELWLTLRGESDKSLAKLEEAIRLETGRLAKQFGLAYQIAEQDRFPATENHPVCAQKVLSACGGSLLSAPMRWSEDFGHYLQHCKGAFFGIGAGETQPPLHTERYVYPDKLLPFAVAAFAKLL